MDRIEPESFWLFCPCFADGFVGREAFEGLRRTDPLADDAAQTALDARIAWIGKGKEIEPKIARVEKWIWLSVTISAAGLLCSALWPAIELSRLLSIVILVACLAPLTYGTPRISSIVNDAFHVVRKQIAEL